MPELVCLRQHCWRVHAPRWAFAPLSGEGASLTGGRFNRPGKPALYLAFDYQTAIIEYEHGMSWRPGTLCAYKVDASVADLREAELLLDFGFSREDVLCNWKEAAFDASRTPPPTWRIADTLIQKGLAGAIYPSAVDPIGTNLVLWRWNTATDDKVEVLDPLDDLPADQRSWQRGVK